MTPRPQSATSRRAAAGRRRAQADGRSRSRRSVTRFGLPVPGREPDPHHPPAVIGCSAYWPQSATKRLPRKRARSLPRIESQPVRRRVGLEVGGRRGRRRGARPDELPQAIARPAVGATRRRPTLAATTTTSPAARGEPRCRVSSRSLTDDVEPAGSGLEREAVRVPQAAAETTRRSLPSGRRREHRGAPAIVLARTRRRSSRSRGRAARRGRRRSLSCWCRPNGQVRARSVRLAGERRATCESQYRESRPCSET